MKTKGAIGVPLGLVALAGGGCLGSGDSPGDDPADASIQLPPDSGRGPPPDPDPDAAPPADASPPDAGVDKGPVHLLITEVMGDRFGGVATPGADFIEIWNPTEKSFDLSSFYLSDAQSYALLPEGNPSVEFGEDFIVKFPNGEVLDPGDVVVVAIEGEGFASAYGAPADFAVRKVGDEASAMDQVVLGSNLDQLGLSDGEGVVLFHWDGNTSLVQDVDMVLAGPQEVDSQQNILDKSDLEVDGPDGPETYRDDAATMARPENHFEAETAAERSYKRIALEGDNLVRGGGNGITGHDETSESIRETWKNHDRPDAYSEPTPGEIPDALRAEAESLRTW